MVNETLILINPALSLAVCLLHHPGTAPKWLKELAWPLPTVIE